MTDSLNNNLSLQQQEGGKSTNMRGTRKKLTIQEMLNFKGNINEHE
jgi:hypothetical protein